MLVVYHEAFSDRYLITLVPSDTPEDAGLAAHLDRACHSSKIAVWIDCRLVRTLSTTVTSYCGPVNTACVIVKRTWSCATHQRT